MVISCSGVYITNQNVQRLYVPVPAAYIADLPEAASIFGVAPHPAQFSDVNTLVPKDKLGEPDFNARTRHVSEMRQVTSPHFTGAIC